MYNNQDKNEINEQRFWKKDNLKYKSCGNSYSSWIQEASTVDRGAGNRFRSAIYDELLSQKTRHLIATLIQCCHLVKTKWQHCSNLAIRCLVCWDWLHSTNSFVIPPRWSAWRASTTSSSTWSGSSREPSPGPRRGWHTYWNTSNLGPLPYSIEVPSDRMRDSRKVGLAHRGSCNWK